MPVNLKYRASVTPSVPGDVSVKNAPLTNLEVDGNFKSISNAIDSTNSQVSTLTTEVATKVSVSDSLAFSIALG